MIQKTIKEMIEKLVNDQGYQLYDCDWVQDGKMQILQVAVMDDQGKMDIDTCAKLSGIISEALDENCDIDKEYYLEVCSPGAERELRSIDEIKQARDEYIYVKLVNPKDGISDVKGYLRDVDDEVINVEYMAKNIKKKVTIELDNISLIRLSVKI